MPGSAEFVGMLDQLGVTGAESPFLTADPEWASALAEGARQGQAMIEKLAGGGGDPKRWSTAKHMFDYNLDRLELGTLDTPEWKIPDRKKAYMSRAVIARAGLWGNHGYEANYDFAWSDQEGATLDGAHAYEVTFSPPPPAKAFWSLTMYDTPKFYLVANPINRYSIGDRTPGLITGDDGSVTIYLQKRGPGRGQGRQLASHAGRDVPPGAAQLSTRGIDPGR